MKEFLHDRHPQWEKSLQLADCTLNGLVGHPQPRFRLRILNHIQQILIRLAEAGKAPLHDQRMQSLRMVRFHIYDARNTLELGKLWGTVDPTFLADLDRRMDEIDAELAIEMETGTPRQSPPSSNN